MGFIYKENETRGEHGGVEQRGGGEEGRRRRGERREKKRRRERKKKINSSQLKFIGKMNYSVYI